MLPQLPGNDPPESADEVEALAAQFLAQLKDGRNPDRQVLLRAHSHLGSRLEHRLILAEMMYRVGLAPEEGPPKTEFATAMPEPASVSQYQPGKVDLAATRQFTDLSASAGRRQGPTVVDGESGATMQGRPDEPSDYEVLAVLGQGGMGIVYKARQRSLNRLVALKMIVAGGQASPKLLARFRIEAEALASLQHPNIVQVYDIGEQNGCPYLAMEFLGGGSLAGQRHPPREAAELVETLARAMHAAHLRGIVHRDLKPANILFTGVTSQAPGVSEEDKDAGSSLTPVSCPLPPVPKITDFGLVKRLGEEKGQTRTGIVLGTPSYMAPEQARGRIREIGPHSDVYSLGAILYEILTSRPPFLGESGVDTLNQVVSQEPPAPSQLCRGLPRDLETICLKCLEKDPVRRYKSAEALADDLRHFLDGEPIAARPVGVFERAWKWIKRRPAAAALIAVVLGAAVTLAASLTWSYTQVLGERDRARHSLEVARESITGLYVKMASERLFDEPQMDPLCQELLEKAQTLYEELAREHSGDPGVRGDIALAWFRLAEIHRLREQRDQAVHAYREAIARQESLFQEHPQESRYLQDLANSHNWLGELFLESGSPVNEAETHFRAALDLQQVLVREFPSEPAYGLELARSHYNLGIIHKNSNRLLEARADYDKSVDLLSQLYHSHPAEPNTRQDLARALINRGVLNRLAGRPTEAGQDYDQSVSLLTELRAEFPARASYKFELAIALQDRGNLLWSQGRNADAHHEQQKAITSYADAQQQHQKALVLLQQLVADFSTRPRYKKKLGKALMNLGIALASARDMRGAEQCLEHARTLFHALAKDDPKSPDYHGLLGMTLGNLGWLQTEDKKWDGARDLFEQSIAQVREALVLNPNHTEYRPQLRDRYRDLAWTLVQLRRPAAAVEAATQMAGVFPEQEQYRYFAACFIARCVPLAKDKELSRKYVDRAMDLLQDVVAKAPPNLERIADEKEVFSDPKLGAVLGELNKASQKRK
jgi:tetratricopeptide (TPR) repeat protein